MFLIDPRAAAALISLAISERQLRKLESLVMFLRAKGA
jgi:hypothetical protein